MNPVLVNDLRKSLFRRKPVHAVALMAVAILVLVFGVSLLIPSTGSWGLREYPFWRFPDILLPLLAPAFAAGAFAKEHEQRTWQDVLLTRLTGSEILVGKFFASILPTLVAMTVLFPPLGLLLIIQGIDWAMEPGPWMLLWGFKTLVSASFYVTVALVVSYHSPNARVSLVVNYCTLAAFALFNYTFWKYFVESYLIPPQFTMQWNGSAYSSVRLNQLGIMVSSADPKQFSLAPADWLFMIQSIFIILILMTYLAWRLRKRRE